MGTSVLEGGGAEAGLEPEAAPAHAERTPHAALSKEVAESVLLLMITVLTLGGYLGVVMALVRVAH